MFKDCFRLNFCMPLTSPSDISGWCQPVFMMYPVVSTHVVPWCSVLISHQLVCSLSAYCQDIWCQWSWHRVGRGVLLMVSVGHMVLSVCGWCHVVSSCAVCAPIFHGFSVGFVRRSRCMCTFRAIINFGCSCHCLWLVYPIRLFIDVMGCIIILLFSLFG